MTYEEALSIVMTFVLENVTDGDTFEPLVSEEANKKNVQEDTIELYEKSSYIIRELAEQIRAMEIKSCNTKKH